MSLPSLGHSEQYFTSYRDHWWNPDYIEALAKRLDLKRAYTLLDVGCGMCHWSKLLLPYLPKGAEVFGVDSDPKWVEEHAERKAYFDSFYIPLYLEEADGEALPYPDNSFDLVTCQTVLIHVPNQENVVREMLRVLKPGGLLLCVEPNNMVQYLMRSSVTQDRSIEETLDHIKYALIAEKGRKILGRGDMFYGDLLPGLFAGVGLGDIEVRLSDNAIPMYPPYEKEDQLATIAQWRTPGFDHHDEAFFRAAGEEFLVFRQLYLEKYADKGKKIAAALQDQTYHAGGATLMYVVSGRKKA